MPACRLSALVSALLAPCLLAPLAAAQSTPAAAPVNPQAAAARVDFGRDVRPILQEHCLGCHGPQQHMNGFRLDIRRDAMRGGTIAQIGPGNAAGSRLYLRVSGEESGMRMPAGGPYLSAKEIETIKNWIDQGAEWPDALSGETPQPAPNPAAMRLMAAIRRGDGAAFSRLLQAEPAAVKARGVDGSTPLMYAALYGDAGQVRRLLAAGADPKAHNDAGSTALMWAATGDLEKTKLLLAAGAEVNARSDNGRSALLIASSKRGNWTVVKALLDAGADVSVEASSLFGPTSPLAEAAFAADPDTMQLLLAHGVNAKSAVGAALGMAIEVHCRRCIDLLIAQASAEDVAVNAMFSVPPFGDAFAVKDLMAHGADPHLKCMDGGPLLAHAAASETLTIESAQSLIVRGADVNAAGPDGRTALDFARLSGKSPLVDLLVASGARGGAGVEPAPAVVVQPADSIARAIRRSLPLLQRTDENFTRKTGCVSCHNNLLTAATVESARRHGVPVDERIAQDQHKVIATYIESWRERVLQAQAIPGEGDTLSYILFGLAAYKHAPDPATDALAQYIRNHQAANGEWTVLAHRPPIESSNITATALSLRALQVYAPPTQRAEYAASVRRAALWLEHAKPVTTEDRAYQLLGMAWAGAPRPMISRTARGLLAAERADGGWAQLPRLDSDAYATGQVMVALRLSGAISASHPAYRRGTTYLLNTQAADGSWFVRTRALPLQPFFDNGFPYGRNQWISAAATNWATQALLLAAPESTQRRRPLHDDVASVRSITSVSARPAAARPTAAELRPPPLAGR